LNQKGQRTAKDTKRYKPSASPVYETRTFDST
jgi:hypothetical protein